MNDKQSASHIYSDLVELMLLRQTLGNAKNEEKRHEYQITAQQGEYDHLLRTYNQQLDKMKLERQQMKDREISTLDQNESIIKEGLADLLGFRNLEKLIVQNGDSIKKTSFETGHKISFSGETIEELSYRIKRMEKQIEDFKNANEEVKKAQWTDVDKLKADSLEKQEQYKSKLNEMKDETEEMQKSLNARECPSSALAGGAPTENEATTAPLNEESAGEQDEIPDGEEDNERRLLNKEGLDQEEQTDKVFYPLMRIADSRKIIENGVDNIERLEEAMREMSEQFKASKATMNDKIAENKQTAQETMETYQKAAEAHRENSENHVNGSGETKHGAFKTGAETAVITQKLHDLKHDNVRLEHAIESAEAEYKDGYQKYKEDWEEWRRVTLEEMDHQLLLLGYQISDADKLEKVFLSFGEENADERYKAEEIEDEGAPREVDEPEGEPLTGQVDNGPEDVATQEEGEVAAQEEGEANAEEESENVPAEDDEAPEGAKQKSHKEHGDDEEFKSEPRKIESLENRVYMDDRSAEELDYEMLKAVVRKEKWRRRGLENFEDSAINATGSLPIITFMILLLTNLL